MDIRPDDPTEDEKARTRYESLVALYPRDRAREMVRACLDAMTFDEDPVFMEGVTDAELDGFLSELAGPLEGATPEQLAEMEGAKQAFSDMRGKKLSELPPPTPEQDAAYVEGETETAVRQMTSAWIQMLWTARDRAGSGAVLLTEELLEATPPVLVGRSSPEGGTHWLEACSVSVALSPGDARELQAAWAARLRPLIDASPDGYVLWSDEFVIKKEERGYVLLDRSAP